MGLRLDRPSTTTSTHALAWGGGCSGLIKSDGLVVLDPFRSRFLSQSISPGLVLPTHRGLRAMAQGLSRPVSWNRLLGRGLYGTLVATSHPALEVVPMREQPCVRVCSLGVGPVY